MKHIKKIIAAVLAAAVIASVLCITSFAGSMAYGVGTVSASCLNIRTSADRRGTVIGKVLRDAKVVILEQTNADFYRINYEGLEGYVASRYLRDVSETGSFIASGKVTDDDVRMRSEPNTNCTTYGYYSTGYALTILGIENGWYKVRNSSYTGYMRSDYVKITSEYVPKQPTQEQKTTLGDPLDKDSQSGNGKSTALGVEIAEYCKQFVGYDYVYGGASPSTGFDCSGLMYYVYGQFGYSLARGATSMYNANGREVSWGQLQPGDLVFFANPDYGEGITHVGMYIGDGKIVHASDYDVGVIISNLESDHYRRTFYAAKRIIDD